MAMKFFKDWLVQKSNTYLIDGVPKILTRDFGTVYQEGDKDKAEYFNEIQKNCIYSVNATRVIEGVLEIYDISITGSDVFPLFNTQLLINFNETNTKIDPVLRWNGKTYQIRKNSKFTNSAFVIGEIQKTNLVVLDQINSIALVNKLNTDSDDVGTIKYVARNFLKNNELKANGAEVSRTIYADLFAAIGTTYGVGDGSTTFKLPDLRGVFIRGLDEGRGLDSGRTLGSYQADDIITHSHTINSDTIYDATGGNAKRILGNQSGSALAASTNSTGGAETRPKNVAMIPIIKY